MENKTTLLVAGIVGVVALGVGFLVGNPSIVVTPADVKVVQSDVPSVGGGASNDIPSSYLRFGGVADWQYRRDLAGDAASTTVCVIQAPQVASSSLRFFGWRANTGTGTAMVLKTYKSASQYVTTTQIGNNMPLAANTMVATTSDDVTTNSVNALFSANDWLVVTATVAAGGAGTSSPTGVCEARWVQI